MDTTPLVVGEPLAVGFEPLAISEEPLASNVEQAAVSVGPEVLGYAGANPAYDDGYGGATVEEGLKLSAVSGQPSASDVEQTASAPSAGELVDAAIAFELVSAIRDRPSSAVEETPNVLGYAVANPAYGYAPVEAVTEEDRLPVRSAVESEEVDDQWLSDELLERVFG